MLIVEEVKKIKEKLVRGKVKEILNWLENNELKGECCIVIEGDVHGEKEEETWWLSLSIPEHVRHYEIRDKLPHKMAMKQVAVDRNISRREVYQQIHVNK